MLKIYKVAPKEYSDDESNSDTEFNNSKSQSIS